MTKPTKKSKRDVRDSIANSELLMSTFHNLQEYEQMNCIKKIFELRNVMEDYYSGYLYPSEDDGIFPYNYPVFKVKIKILERQMSSKNVFVTCFIISSIDDSGVSMFGPEESLEEARGRMNEAVDFVSNLEFRCPSKQFLTEFCDTNSLEMDYW